MFSLFASHSFLTDILPSHFLLSLAPTLNVFHTFIHFPI